MNLDDVERVHAIDAQSFSLPWPERSFRFELTQNPVTRSWVAEVDNPASGLQVVGFVVIWLIVDEAHVGTLAIHPDYRQQGIATKMLAQALLDAQQAGAVTSFLEVRRSNLAAQHLYRSFGFEVVGTRSRYYRDNQEDALLMTLNGLAPQTLAKMLEEAG
ncbi:MAG: ribosomal protein S18-alanine N-acetyltransferase [Chloroflexi bacterium]|nr:ribosomal protein S18-alanine N-acetyltransferase [Chloroflexota bacterium]